ncbi:MAG TPA: oligosaccharide flippase family protein [Planctomycetaceae bacterium]|nr:oligosaccharide flippase family protein [Planctomycetaceae bacterium]
MHFNAILTAVTRMISAFLFLGATVYLARLLGPEGQGQYAFAMTLAATITQFANLGLHAGNTYLVAQDRARLPALLANSVWISLGLGGIAGSVTFALGQSLGWVDGSPLWLALLGGALVAARLFFSLGGSLLAGLGRVRALNIAELLNYGSTMVLLIVVGSLGGDIFSLMVATLAAWTGASAVMFALLVQTTGLSLQPDKRVFLVGWTYAAKAYAMSLLGFLVLRTSVFLIESFHGKGEVGQYSVASQMFDFLNLLPASLALVLLPRLVQDAGSRWTMTLKSVGIIGGVMIIACLGAACFAAPTLQLLFGDRYADATPILLAMLPAAFFCSLTTVASQYLAAAGYPQELFAIWGGAWVATVALGSVFIRSSGGYGAAITLSLVYAAAFVLSLGLAYLTEQRRLAASRIESPSLVTPRRAAA